MYKIEHDRVISSSAFSLLIGLLIIASYPYIVTIGSVFILFALLSFLLVVCRWYFCVICGISEFHLFFIKKTLRITTVVRLFSVFFLFVAAFYLYRRYGWFHPLTVNGLVILVAWLKFCDGNPHRDAIGVFLISTVVFSESIISGYDSISYLFLFLLFVSMSLISLNNHNVNVVKWAFVFLFSRLLLFSLPLVVVCYLLFPRLPTVLFSWQLEGVNSWFSTQEESFDSSGKLSTSTTGGRAAKAQAETFNLDQLSSLSKVDTTLFTVTFDNTVPDMDFLYWRAAVFWRYDGETWKQRERWQKEGGADAFGVNKYPTTRYHMVIPAHGKRWLYGLDFPVYRPQGTLMTRDQQLIAVDSLNKDFSYDVESILVGATKRRVGLTRFEKKAALHYPPGSNPRLYKFGRAMKGKESTLILEKLLSHYSHAGFSYDIDRFPSAGKQSLDDFVFESKVGQCGHYASSLVLYLRAAGVPARLVTGFRGGRAIVGAANSIEVTSMMAHAWVEYWTGDYWFRMDPTIAVSGQSTVIVPATGELYSEPRVDDEVAENAEVDYFYMLKSNLEESIDLIFRHYNVQLQEQLLVALGIDRLKFWMLPSSIVFLFMVYCCYAYYSTKRKILDSLDVYQFFQKKLASQGLEINPCEGPENYKLRAAAYFSVNRNEIIEICNALIVIRYGFNDDENELRKVHSKIKSLVF